jgi:predicted nucleic acid-binding protein
MTPDLPMEPNLRPPRPLVLDTNVLLDWLVFHDPSTTALDNALRRGVLRWIATPAMREELEQVLTRKHLLLRQADPLFALTTWNRFAQIVEPTSMAQAGTMRCTDPDDQKFIDLALRHGAVLLSRDRAVLHLARAGLSRGMQIMTAAQWAASEPDPAPQKKEATEVASLDFQRR